MNTKLLRVLAISLTLAIGVALADPPIGKLWYDDHDTGDWNLVSNPGKGIVVSNSLLYGVQIPCPWNQILRDDPEDVPDWLTSFEDNIRSWDEERDDVPGDLVPLHYIIRFAPDFCPCWVLNESDPENPLGISQEIRGLTPSPA